MIDYAVAEATAGCSVLHMVKQGINPAVHETFCIRRWHDIMSICPPLQPIHPVFHRIQALRKSS